MPDTSKRDQPRRVPAQPEHLPAQRADPSALARLFEEWMHGDEKEQRDTFEVLRCSLDEDRPAGYRLFPLIPEIADYEVRREFAARRPGQSSRPPGRIEGHAPLRAARIWRDISWRACARRAIFQSLPTGPSTSSESA